MNTRSLLARLLPIAAGGAALACGPSSGAPASPSGATALPSAAPSPPPASAPVARGTSPQAAGADPAERGSPSCHEGLSCVVGSSCFFVTQRDGDIPNTGRLCRCDERGAMRCPGTAPPRDAMLVCIPKVGATCLAPDEPHTRSALNAAFEPGCPMLLAPASAGERKTSAGTESCCYQARLGMCQGRPLLVAGALRIARRRPGAWG